MTCSKFFLLLDKQLAAPAREDAASRQGAWVVDINTVTCRWGCHIFLCKKHTVSPILSPCWYVGGSELEAELVGCVLPVFVCVTLTQIEVCFGRGFFLFGFCVCGDGFTLAVHWFVGQTYHISYHVIFVQCSPLHTKNLYPNYDGAENFLPLAPHPLATSLQVHLWKRMRSNMTVLH